MSPVIEGFLLLSAKCISDDDKQMYSKLLLHRKMICLRQCGNNGVSIPDHIVFSAYIEATFPVARVSIFLPSKERGIYLLPFIQLDMQKK